MCTLEHYCSTKRRTEGATWVPRVKKGGDKTVQEKGKGVKQVFLPFCRPAQNPGGNKSREESHSLAISDHGSSVGKTWFSKRRREGVRKRCPSLGPPNMHRGKRIGPQTCPDPKKKIPLNPRSKFCRGTACSYKRAQGDCKSEEKKGELSRIRLSVDKRPRRCKPSTITTLKEKKRGREESVNDQSLHKGRGVRVQMSPPFLNIAKQEKGEGGKRGGERTNNNGV